MKPKEKTVILEGKERKKIINILKEQFGIEEIEGTLIKRGKEKIYFFTGSFTKEDIRKLEKTTFIERTGVYLAKEIEGKLRLSIEGSQILKNKITKNIVELNRKEVETWMMGHEIEKKTGLKDYVIIKYKEDMLGTGRASEEKITNFIPKSRRLKDKTIEN